MLPKSMNARAISAGCKAVSATIWLIVTCPRPRIPEKDKIIFKTGP